MTGSSLSRFLRRLWLSWRSRSLAQFAEHSSRSTAEPEPASAPALPKFSIELRAGRVYIQASAEDLASGLTRPEALFIAAGMLVALGTTREELEALTEALEKAGQ